MKHTNSNKLNILHLFNPINLHNSLLLHIFTQHSTAQHSTAQHSTAQHSTAQHSTLTNPLENILAESPP